MSVAYMYDDVTASLIPTNAEVVAYYVDGLYANGVAIRERCPHAVQVSIAVRASDDAEVLDDEPGDATIPEIYGWLKRQLARGVHAPGIYTSVSNVDKMMLTMNANRFRHGTDFRIWSAHYGAGAHICGPNTCKLTRTACDWTQYTDRAQGKSLDESELPGIPSFAGTPVTPSDWTYGPPTRLTARAGHTSVYLAWRVPNSAPEKPAEYQVYIYRGKACSIRTLVHTYPRLTQAMSFQGGSLTKKTLYTAHIVAAGTDGSRIRPYTYASIEFTTGG